MINAWDVHMPIMLDDTGLLFIETRQSGSWLRIRVQQVRFFCHFSVDDDKAVEDKTFSISILSSFLAHH